MFSDVYFLRKILLIDLMLKNILKNVIMSCNKCKNLRFVGGNVQSMSCKIKGIFYEGKCENFKPKLFHRIFNY